MRTGEQIRKDIEELRSRHAYRVSIVALRVVLLAFPAFGAGWWLQYTSVPKQIAASIIVACFVAGFCGGLLYFVAGLYLAIEQSVKARSIYNPTANLAFARAFLGDLFRPIVRLWHGFAGRGKST